MTISPTVATRAATWRPNIDVHRLTRDLTAGVTLVGLFVAFLIGGSDILNKL